MKTAVEKVIRTWTTRTEIRTEYLCLSPSRWWMRPKLALMTPVKLMEKPSMMYASLINFI
jgi:hypothetical protein